MFFVVVLTGRGFGGSRVNKKQCRGGNPELELLEELVLGHSLEGSCFCCSVVLVVRASPCCTAVTGSHGEVFDCEAFLPDFSQ